MKFKVFWLMLLISLPGYSQEGEVTRPEDLEQRVHVIGTPSQPAPSVNPDQHSPTESSPAPVDEEDELLHKLEADRKKQAEMAIKIDQAKESLTTAAFNAPLELKKLGYDQITAAAMMDEKVVKIVKKMMQQSTLKNASDDEVRNMMFEKAKGSFMEKFLKNNPKITNTFVEILKDEKAMPSLVGIFLRRSDLKLYAAFWFGLMILAWLIKKITFKKEWTSGKRMGMSLLVSLCVTATSLTIFYNMFSAEISPTAKIIVKHWRKRNL